MLSSTWWCGSTRGVTGWPDGEPVSIAADTSGASLGTAAVATLATAAIVVLAKYLLEGRRRRDKEKLEKILERYDKETREMVIEIMKSMGREPADIADQSWISQLEDALRANGIDVPPDPNGESAK